MTTTEDKLHDACYAAAAEYCLSIGLRAGIARIASVMAQAGADEAEDIAAEHAKQAEMSL